VLQEIQQQTTKQVQTMISSSCTRSSIVGVRATTAGSSIRRVSVCSATSKSSRRSCIINNNSRSSFKTITITTPPITTKSCLQQQQSQRQQRWLSNNKQDASNKATTTTTTTTATTTAVEEGTIVYEPHTVRSWIYEQWEKGNILFLTSFFIFLYALDLQLRYNEQENDETQKKFGTRKEQIKKMQNEIKLIRQQVYNNYKNYPTLYKCQINIVYKLGGSHGLLNIKQNDIIDILEENVGPQNDYHMCRSYKIEKDSDGKEIKSISSIGWYPKVYMTPIPNKTITSRSIWIRLFGSTK
jgi:hypothetical protein